MNPLPRLLAMSLFVVLAVLTALLAAPAWRAGRGEPPVDRATADTASPPTSPAAGSTAPRAARILALPQKFALALMVVALALAVTLVFSLALRPARPVETKTPLAAARGEIDTLAKLAETSAAQGAELTRERDVRRRAEEDGQLQQHLLAQSRDEKIQLGRDLHDGIIQSLYAVGLTLESMRILMKTNPAEADRLLDQSRAGLNNAIRDVRAYITGLAPETLRRASFAQSVDALLAELRAGRDARFDIKIDDEAAALLSPEQSLDALQIAREAVSNALRHGGASLITIRVHQGDREVGLLVQDNGTGFDAASRRDGGFGLGNMHARAARLGAQFRVTSKPGEGTRVIATLPILEPTSV